MDEKQFILFIKQVSILIKKCTDKRIMYSKIVLNNNELIPSRYILFWQQQLSQVAEAASMRTFTLYN
jgi:hypothetical protein